MKCLGRQNLATFPVPKIDPRGKLLQHPPLHQLTTFLRLSCETQILDFNLCNRISSYLDVKIFDGGGPSHGISARAGGGG